MIAALASTLVLSTSPLVMSTEVETSLKDRRSKRLAGKIVRDSSTPLRSGRNDKEEAIAPTAQQPLRSASPHAARRDVA